MIIDVENARLAANGEGNEAIATDENEMADEASVSGAPVEERSDEPDPVIDQDSEIAEEKINSTVARMRVPGEKEDDAGDGGSEKGERNVEAPVGRSRSGKRE